MRCLGVVAVYYRFYDICGNDVFEINELPEKIVTVYAYYVFTHQPCRLIYMSMHERDHYFFKRLVITLHNNITVV